MESVNFLDENVECRHILAHHIWQILTEYVMFRENISNQGKILIHDADLAELLGYDRQAAITLEEPLRDIHRFCEKNYLPHLNVIVLKQETSLAWRAEIFSNLTRHLREQNRVKQFNWLKVRTPTAGTFKEYSKKNTLSEIARLEAAVGGLLCNNVPSSSIHSLSCPL